MHNQNSTKPNSILFVDFLRAKFAPSIHLKDGTVGRSRIACAPKSSAYFPTFPRLVRARTNEFLFCLPWENNSSRSKEEKFVLKGKIDWIFRAIFNICVIFFFQSDVLCLRSARRPNGK